MDRICIAYPAIFLPQDEGGYTVEFPDLEGCISEGDTFAEAHAMAAEALTGWLESEISRGNDIPDPTVIEGAVLVQPDPTVAAPLMIRKARKAAGLTQKQMAARMGMAYTSYQHLEYPKKFNATLKSLERVSEALGLRVHIELVR